MTEKGLSANIIAHYMDLLRIQSAQDKDSEVENQLCEARAQLEALGVVVEKLVIR